MISFEINGEKVTKLYLDGNNEKEWLNETD